MASSKDEISKNILVTRNLKKYFGEVHAVDGVNLSILEGEVAFIIGPNGAGKTTFLNLLCKWLEPDEGKIFFMGKDVTKMPPYKLTKMGIGRSFQLVNLYDTLTVFDNIRVAVISRLGRSGKIFSLVDRDKEVAKETEEILKTFGLSDKKDLLASELPHGDRKLLDVAIPFALKPKLLLLDEPTSGVSTEEKDPVMKTIVSAVKAAGTTALIIEHDMSIVFSYSDRVIAMHEGKILADGKPKEVQENKLVKTLIMGE